MTEIHRAHRHIFKRPTVRSCPLLSLRVTCKECLAELAVVPCLGRYPIPPGSDVVGVRLEGFPKQGLPSCLYIEERSYLFIPEKREMSHTRRRRPGLVFLFEKVLSLGCFREQDLSIGAWMINRLTWQVGVGEWSQSYREGVSYGPRTMLAILCWSYFRFFIHPSTSK